MYVEERTYQLLPGRAAEYLSLYEAKGMRAQTRYLPNMLGYYFAEIGTLNEVVHLWLHESLDAREVNRAAMRADAEFQAYWNEVRVMIVRQQTRILKPAPFFQERLGAFARVMADEAIK